ncbi:autotransporter assembly complex protein TamA [Terricaulis sp.]|uniref:autotransporter assembly complex protein TamA n=1 Tax=Terricaulis sp. TaxID=2768686 RepID=UPI002AC496B5|nr:BamA/TamA family outer membrane protein [Terricaulis sp.]MDZ4691238.1 BamA/TamA family outer membrane protein [Terricaulis sp.]
MRLFPVLPAALAAAVALAAPPAAWADSPVVVEGGDKDMRDTIRDLLPDRERPTSLFDAERIAEEAAARARVWLRSEGYYGATVTPEATEEPPAARLIIEAGQRFSFADPSLAYAGATPDSATDLEARNALSLVPEGAPARSGAVLEAEATALAALHNGGYPDAAAQPRRVVVDHAANSVTPAYQFDAGARAYLGDVRAEPSTIFRPGFIDDLQNWGHGETYSPDALTRLRRDLSSTGAVTSVSTRLDEPNANGVRDVILEIEPARRNAYELGLSYSTTEGAGVVGQWTRRNFTGRADSLITSATLAELQQELSVALVRPHAAGLGHAVTIGVSAEREAPAAYTRQGLALYANVDASTRLRLGRSYGLRLSADQYDDLVGSVNEAVVLSGFYNLRHDTTELTLDPLDGSILEFRVEPSVSSGDATLGFVRASAEARGYESFGRENSLTLAARIRAGWLEAVAGSADDVPPDRRFYAGGGGSVRGYEYNSIYPLERDLLGLTPGGQGVVEGSIEARWRFASRLGAVAFIDGGTAFDDWADAGDLSFGVGVGLRYDLGFAPLRFDVAVPLDDEFSSDDYALYISIGQAF